VSVVQGDVFTRLEEAGSEQVGTLSTMLEERGADERQRRMRLDYLDRIVFPPGAYVVDVGCGTGVVTREVARRAGVGSVLGIDSSDALLDDARRLGGRGAGIEYLCADAQRLPLPDAQVDVAIYHTLFSHLPDPRSALAEGARILKRGGCLVVFDGDYATVNVEGSDHDPLQACVEAWRTAYVHDCRIMRALPAMARDCGLVDIRSDAYAYLPVPDDSRYALSILDRGADVLAGEGIGLELAQALKAEARRRLRIGRFHAGITYILLTATR
jgi:arsenite methyltransferase